MSEDDRSDDGAAASWIVLQHVDHEGPGLIGEGLTEAGRGWHVVRPDRGQALPAAASVAGLVVMGGPMGVHDTDDHPWLVPERELLGELVRAGRPVLGICLGAQQLAASLGADVTAGPEPEIGLGWLELTPAGRRDPVLGPEYGGLADPAVPCVHWHRDTFSLPEDAVHLAATARFPHQAFRVGAAGYGFQFHVEVDGALAEAWRARLPAGVDFDGPRLAAVEATGRRVLRRFFAGPAGGTGQGIPSRAGTAR